MSINPLTTGVVIAVSLLVVGVFVVIAWGLHLRRAFRTEFLRSRFGLDYEITLNRLQSRRLAEAELEARLRRN